MKDKKIPLKKYGITAKSPGMLEWAMALKVEELELIRLMRLKGYAIFDVALACGLPVNVHIEGSAMLHSFTGEATAITLCPSDISLIEYIRYVGYGGIHFEVRSGEYVYDPSFTKCIKSYDLRTEGATKELDFFLKKEYNEQVQTKQSSGHVQTQGI